MFVKVPGKLFLAGEYAIIQPGNRAILFTVNRFVSVEIMPSPVCFIESNLLPNRAYWERISGQVELSSAKHLPFVQASIAVVEQYLREQGYLLKEYGIRITSDLTLNGKKLGLGSSGAVTVGIIRAILMYFTGTATNELVYKLGVMAHLRIHATGSFADLAACTYTGYIMYQSPNLESIKESLKTKPISEIVADTWPNLTISKLTPPKSFQILIGWTGEPASTAKLVNHITKTDSFQNFVTLSQQPLDTILRGFTFDDYALIKEGVLAYRSLLCQLSPEIETLKLKQLCEIAEKYHGVGKSSGAGGGDCGIALLEQDHSPEKIYEDWQMVGIEPLDLMVYNEKLSHDI